ncbi:hypothetical protein ACFFJT_06350 [Dyella flava]|uniref:Uncharacterized protein n=1 Tax=Dyella flava TaxID=1920170 RepID=A0ABS2K0V5_9GAMM|nr:hypothetical protein [Dyella flava]MBM7124863.1 hypothetical protein [Dyella flava]GLQ50904.1 hypothetical protein GCM10010872_23530 [Dyella flava]
MNHVPPERVDLIRQWNERKIALTEEHLSAINAIGATPPDVYGNGRQYRETPCAITTIHGSSFDLAIVSIQEHASFEEWRHCYLASDIKEVRPSPFALSHEIRVATSRADEIRMGFAPTVVELPSGEIVALNWRQNFLVKADCDASQVIISQRRLDWREPPPVLNTPPGIVYFVADQA